MLAAAVFFGIVALVLWVDCLRSRKAKRENREVGYLRADIEIDARAVPQFRPTWRDMRDKGEAR